MLHVDFFERCFVEMFIYVALFLIIICNQMILHCISCAAGRWFQNKNFKGFYSCLNLSSKGLLNYSVFVCFVQMLFILVDCITGY